MTSKFDRCRRWSRIKTNSNYIDKVSRDHFHGDLGWLSLFFNKKKRELIAKGLTRNRIARNQRRKLNYEKKNSEK